jgi:hypothetical protein
VSEIHYPYYRSFLLRIWQESEQSPWRGSLQSVDDGNTVAFGELESLLLFLLNRSDQPPSIHDSTQANDVQ